MCLQSVLSGLAAHKCLRSTTRMSVGCTNFSKASRSSWVWPLVESGGTPALNTCQLMHMQTSLRARTWLDLALATLGGASTDAATAIQCAVLCDG